MELPAIGKGRMVTQMPKEKPKVTIMTKGDFFQTVPHESHALKALQNSLLLVITKGPRSGRNYESDTFRLDIPLLSLEKRK